MQKLLIFFCKKYANSFLQKIIRSFCFAKGKKWQCFYKQLENVSLTNWVLILNRLLLIQPNPLDASLSVSDYQCFVSSLFQAIGIMSLPQNIPEALSNLTNLTDEIWYHAGDTSTDVSEIIFI